MRRCMNILGRAVGHQQSILVVEIPSVVGCPIDGLLRAGPILWMNALNDRIERDGRCLVVAKYSKSLLRPDNFPGDDTPAEAAGVAQSLCFGQIVSTLPQGVFSLLALGDVLACDQDDQPVILPSHGFGVFTNP